MEKDRQTETEIETKRSRKTAILSKTENTMLMSSQQ